MLHALSVSTRQCRRSCPYIKPPRHSLGAAWSHSKARPFAGLFVAGGRGFREPNFGWLRACDEVRISRSETPATPGAVFHFLGRRPMHTGFQAVEAPDRATVNVKRTALMAALTIII